MSKYETAAWFTKWDHMHATIQAELQDAEQNAGFIIESSSYSLHTRNHEN